MRTRRVEPPAGAGLQRQQRHGQLPDGLGLDQPLLRTAGSSTSYYLSDALGSIVGLASTTGTVPTSYTYEPYGKTTVSGTSSASFFGFTGRENDSTGTLSLYNYRARAYSPTLQRFLTEDPLGLAGGDVNLYSYIANGPTYGSDPSGMFLPSDSYGNSSTAPLGSRKDMKPGPEVENYYTTTPQPSSGSSGVECVVAAGFGGQIIAAGGEFAIASLAPEVIGVSLVAGLFGAFIGAAIIGFAIYAIVEGCT